MMELGVATVKPTGTQIWGESTRWVDTRQHSISWRRLGACQLSPRQERRWRVSQRAPVR
jgi:hypothetical protein